MINLYLKRLWRKIVAIRLFNVTLQLTGQGNRFLTPVIFIVITVLFFYNTIGGYKVAMDGIVVVKTDS